MSIWDTAEFSSAGSPIQDILDRDVFKLEELLDEAELLQEVRGNNEKLLKVLTTAKSISRMISLAIEPHNKDATFDKEGKWATVSCELIASYIPAQLDVFVDLKGEGNMLLNQLFSILKEESPLDSVRSGLFYKLLSVLVKHRPIPLLSWLYVSDSDLVASFLKHFDNASIASAFLSLMSLTERDRGLMFEDLIHENGLLTKDIGWRGKEIKGMDYNRENAWWKDSNLVVKRLIDQLSSTSSSSSCYPNISLFFSSIAAKIKLVLSVNASSTLTGSHLYNLYQEMIKKESINQLTNIIINTNTHPLSRTQTCVILSHILDNVIMEIKNSNSFNDDDDDVIYRKEKKSLLSDNSDSENVMEKKEGNIVLSICNDKVKALSDILNRESEVLLRLNVVEVFFKLMKTNNTAINSNIVQQGVLATILNLMIINENNSILHILIGNIVEFILERGNNMLRDALLNDFMLIKFILKASSMNTDKVKKKKAFMPQVRHMANTLLYIHSLGSNNNDAHSNEDEEDGVLIDDKYAALLKSSMPKRSHEVVYTPWQSFIADELTAFNLHNNYPLLSLFPIEYMNEEKREEVDLSLDNALASLSFEDIMSEKCLLNLEDEDQDEDVIEDGKGFSEKWSSFGGDES